MTLPKVYKEGPLDIFLQSLIEDCDYGVFRQSCSPLPRLDHCSAHLYNRYQQCRHRYIAGGSMTLPYSNRHTYCDRSAV